MKKIVYLVCEILTLWLIVENFNFMYAGNDDISLVIENDKVIVDENVEESNNLEDKNKIEKISDNDEETNEVIVEPDNQS